MAGLSKEDLNRRFVAALGDSVRHHGPLEERPVEIDLTFPLPQRVRVYIFTLTNPPGGRPLDEYKVQVTIGKRRGRASFDDSDGRIPLLLGYLEEEDVFVLWDAELMKSFAYSRNVQVKANAIVEALSGKLARHPRRVRPDGKGKSVEMIVLATQARLLPDAIHERMELTRARLRQDYR